MHGCAVFGVSAYAYASESRDVEALTSANGRSLWKQGTKKRSGHFGAAFGKFRERVCPSNCFKISPVICRILPGGSRDSSFPATISSAAAARAKQNCRQRRAKRDLACRWSSQFEPHPGTSRRRCRQITYSEATEREKVRRREFL